MYNSAETVPCYSSKKKITPASDRVQRRLSGRVLDFYTLLSFLNSGMALGSFTGLHITLSAQINRRVPRISAELSGAPRSCNECVQGRWQMGLKRVLEGGVSCHLCVCARRTRPALFKSKADSHTCHGKVARMGLRSRLIYNYSPLESIAGN